MVKRKAIEAVEMELQERTFGNNRVNHAPSHSDVVAAFSSSPCEDACWMLTPTDAELSAHYISGNFVVSNECAVTRHMSELMSRGLKVVCSQRCLSPSHDNPPPQTPSHRSPSPQTPPHRSPPHQTPPHRSPPLGLHPIRLHPIAVHPLGLHPIRLHDRAGCIHRRWSYQCTGDYSCVHEGGNR
ncbi:hypothetical protein F511_04945 [Dorcoceras hygrometricum]|uniref:Uncharacterized protein n=1 Tax=Dorcoceras hygrometricum TaxID=472368 RepID=A0A2Z7BK54_9LAMI|nr:hypothetical protein F511_04945 [Dorcoceras hygrometricum]